MLTASPLLSGRPLAAVGAPLETSVLLDVDRAHELLHLCAQESHPIVLSGVWVQQQCGVSAVQGPLWACGWGHGRLTLRIGDANLFWHERQVARTEWRRWREPLGLRHGLRLWDEAHAVALTIGAPLRSPHCEGALWRAWMDWIADIPLCDSHRHAD